MSELVNIHNLNKTFGTKDLFEELSFSVAANDKISIIGPNGAGKTTTMRILATLLNPTWGEAYVGGYSIYT